MTRWAVVCTTNAERDAVLDFVAWHLELGAARIALYLDADDPATEAALAGHPRVRAIRTDRGYWEAHGGRPAKHQVRQVRNATHAYRAAGDVDWLAHVDVDEFLVPESAVSDALAALPRAVPVARVRPIEALAPGAGDAPGTRSFKAFHVEQRARTASARACFGHWADHLSGGFLSHVAGKVLVRTGMPGIELRIHNALSDGVQLADGVELPQVVLAHLHADSWERFRAAYRFRLARGSYRDGLKPQARGSGALSLHELFRAIEADGGEPALAAFYAEVATATPALCAALEAEGLLRRLAFAPEALRARHFPGTAGAKKGAAGSRAAHAAAPARGPD